MVVHDADATAVVYVRVPGSVKNRIVALAGSQGVSVNAWAANVLLRALELGEGLPEAPRGVAPVPDGGAVLRAYVEGERVLLPCGERGSCEGLGVGRLVVGGVEFCSVCRIRVG